MIAANSNQTDARATGAFEEFVTVMVADQIFGLPIDRVHDVFIASSLTAVPLAPREIVGLLNLRGRVVTAMCLRRRLGLPDRADTAQNMAVGLERQGESYGLLVDSVGEVMKLSPERQEPNPVHMDGRWVKLSRGVHRLDDKLLIILDVDAVLSFDVDARAA
ncbi:chemotaxis protein CheW [Salinarimonas soli]|uniref:Chemotaxis protein CheW n=1 Tax=Salinarimonas soli TaxID=1638099 RepID=A0A5B2VBB9_9HYPH|nr:chemotaxis protein CheW [Salinarimonas soli]KAA2235712.1 chemotaxis protein CheW [Salinarimonas soli]